MRLTVSIFLLCGVGAAIWAEASGRNTEVEARSPGRIAPPAVQAGLRAHVSQLPGVSVIDIVIGEAAEGGGWSFRARALDPDWPAGPALPVYGRADPSCDVGMERPDCWRLSVLEIDGQDHPKAAR